MSIPDNPLTCNQTSMHCNTGCPTKGYARRIATPCLWAQCLIPPTSIACVHLQRNDLKGPLPRGADSSSSLLIHAKSDSCRGCGRWHSSHYSWNAATWLEVMLCWHAVSEERGRLFLLGEDTTLPRRDSLTNGNKSDRPHQCTGLYQLVLGIPILLVPYWFLAIRFRSQLVRKHLAYFWYRPTQLCFA